ncbi:hypothetical protein [Actinoplanes ianthinogenes]|nr:hypothetical protein [Actinoplanes ianthinogenes]
MPDLTLREMPAHELDERRDAGIRGVPDAQVSAGTRSGAADHEG